MRDDSSSCPFSFLSIITYRWHGRHASVFFFFRSLSSVCSWYFPIVLFLLILFRCLGVHLDIFPLVQMIIIGHFLTIFSSVSFWFSPSACIYIALIFHNKGGEGKRWYTRESCLYRILNKTLSFQDYDKKIFDI